MMGTSDGSVLGTTKIVDHGPDTARWNLVIVGDGYRSTEMATYHADVETFLTELRNAVPFDELFCGINVYRIDVVSTESGADDPGCAGGPAVTAATYFDATYCTPMFSGTPLDRLLSVDSASVLSVVNARVPLKDQVICIVNSAKYGGSGGTIATCASGSPEVALHEMCHSAFGLADEYGGDGSATPPVNPRNRTLREIQTGRRINGEHGSPPRLRCLRSVTLLAVRRRPAFHRVRRLRPAPSERMKVVSIPTAMCIGHCLTVACETTACRFARVRGCCSGRPNPVSTC